MATQNMDRGIQSKTPALTGSPPRLEGIYSARDRLRPYLHTTPLYESAALSQALASDVWLKVETTTPIASFKLRGALNALLALREREVPISSAVTSSTGNHGQGVALAASWLGLPSDIFVPEGADPVKQKMIRLFGGNLHVGGYDLDAAKELAKAHAMTTGGVFVDDGDEPAVIEGAGTIGIEIAEALQGIDAVFAPMGSGSLASGVAIGLKGIQPSAKVVAIQSSAAPAMVESFWARRAIEMPANTQAGCLVCRVPAQVALNALIQHVDECVLVSDNELFASVHALAAWGHLLAELGAAAGLAAAWSRRSELKGKRIVILVTGANSSPAMLAHALAGPALFNESAFRPR